MSILKKKKKKHRIISILCFFLLRFRILTFQRLPHRSLLIAHCGTGFQPAVGLEFGIRRQMLAHFPTVTQSTGFQPESLLTGVLVTATQSTGRSSQGYE